METLNRQVLLLKLTRKLVICTAVLLAIILMFFFTPAFFDAESSATASDPDAQKRSFLTLIVFGTGLIGGFVSIQQRIHRVTDEELKHLSESWSGVLLIPIYGGIFAIVLHVIFLSEILTGELFPRYWTNTFAKPTPTIEDFKTFFITTVPMSGPDTAKMLFWAFCAGFSERLVPQIIQKVQSRVTDSDKQNLSMPPVSDGTEHRG